MSDVEDERQKLRRDVERYRFLLGSISELSVVTLLREMITEAEAQLKLLDGRRPDDPRSAPDPTTGRRQAGVDSPSTLTPKLFEYMANWRIDLRSRYITSPEGKTVRLTRGEFDLLLALLSRADQVVSRDELMVMSRHRAAGPAERTIDVLIGRLRRKLEPDPRHPTLIITMHGEGYLLRSRSRG